MSEAGTTLSILKIAESAFPHATDGILNFRIGLMDATNAAGVASAAFSGLWTVISAHPILAAVAAIGALSFAYDKLNVTVEEAYEKMDKSFESYDFSQQELDQTNSNLADINSKN